MIPVINSSNVCPHCQSENTFESEMFWWGCPDDMRVADSALWACLECGEQFAVLYFPNEVSNEQ